MYGVLVSAELLLVDVILDIDEEDRGLVIDVIVDVDEEGRGLVIDVMLDVDEEDHGLVFDVMLDVDEEDHELLIGDWLSVFTSWAPAFLLFSLLASGTFWLVTPVDDGLLVGERLCVDEVVSFPSAWYTPSSLASGDD